MVRRSCHPSAGPTGSPVRRSHTTVDARWLQMPIPSTGPAAASACSASVRVQVREGGRVELDQPVGRRVGQQLARDFERNAHVVVQHRRAHAARADVEDENPQ